jgi:pentose-5-phosphate-3-epimerase
MRCCLRLKVSLIDAWFEIMFEMAVMMAVVRARARLAPLCVHMMIHNPWRQISRKAAQRPAKPKPAI